MPFSKPSVEESSKDIKSRLDVSKTINKRSHAVAGPRAEIEVAPRDSSCISLGKYEHTDQPKDSVLNTAPTSKPLKRMYI